MADNPDQPELFTPPPGFGPKGYKMQRRRQTVQSIEAANATLDTAHLEARRSLELTKLNNEAAQYNVHAAQLITGAAAQVAQKIAEAALSLGEAKEAAAPPTNKWDAAKALFEAVGETMKGDAGQRLIGKVEDLMMKVLGSGGEETVAAAPAPAAPASPAPPAPAPVPPPAAPPPAAPSAWDELAQLPPELAEMLSIKDLGTLRAEYLKARASGYTGTFGVFAREVFKKYGEPEPTVDKEEGERS